MRIFKISLVIIGIIIAAIFILLSSGTVSIPDSTNFILIEDQEGQAKLKSKLEDIGIPVSTNERGAIFYNSKYSESVLSLAKETMSSSSPTSTTVRYSEPKYTELLIERLKANNVPFNIEYIKNEKYVGLSYRERKIWLPIKQEIDRIFIQEHKKSIKKQ